MNGRPLLFWFWGSLLLALLLAPFLASGDLQARALREQNLKAIARMSESEQQHLQQNYEEFRKRMNAEGRAAVRSLYEAVEQDRTQGRGELRSVMQTYYNWLKTIEPYQRDALYKKTDPRERIAFMNEIIRKQRERSAERAMNWGAPGWSPESDRGRRTRSFVMDSETLAKVMSAIEQRAVSRLTREQVQSFGALQGLTRYVQLLRNLKELDLTKRPLADAPPDEVQQVAEQIDQFVVDSRVRDFVNEPNDYMPEKGVRFAIALSMSLQFELFKQRRLAEYRLDHAQLQTYFESLKTEQQNELLQLEASDFLADLRNEYLDQNSETELPDSNEIRELFRRPRRDGFREEGGDNRSLGPPRDGPRPGDRPPDGPRGALRGRFPGPPPRAEPFRPPEEPRAEAKSPPP